MGIDFARASFAVAEYRKTPIRVSTAVKTRDPLAVELEFNTLLEDETDAIGFGEYILSLRSAGRNDWVLLATKNSIVADIGDTITLFYDRFGLSTGKNFIIKRSKKMQSALFDEFTLYGPQ